MFTERETYTPGKAAQDILMGQYNNRVKAASLQQQLSLKTHFITI